MFTFSLAQGVALRRCALMFWTELRLRCRVSWNRPVSLLHLLYLSSIESNICKFTFSLCDNKTFFCSIRTEKGRHLCSRDSGGCFQDPSCQRENQQILREGIEHHTECWRSCGQRMCPAGLSDFGFPPSRCWLENCHISSASFDLLKIKWEGCFLSSGLKLVL